MVLASGIMVLDTASVSASKYFFSGGRFSKIFFRAAG
jgi:hypothetical protein